MLGSNSFWATGIRIFVAGLAAYIGSAFIWMGPVGVMWAETRFRASMEKIKESYGKENANPAVYFLVTFLSLILLAYIMDQWILPSHYFNIRNVKTAVLFSFKLTLFTSLLQIQNYTMNYTELKYSRYLIMAVDFLTQFIAVSVITATLTILS